jgi:hypothetical protein
VEQSPHGTRVARPIVSECGSLKVGTRPAARCRF